MKTYNLFINNSTKNDSNSPVNDNDDQGSNCGINGEERKCIS